MFQVSESGISKGVSPGRGAVRALVADDHPLYREGIARAIKDRPGLELVGECESGTEALDTIRSLRPDVAVLDFDMPGMNGAQVIAALGPQVPTRSLLLSAHTDAPLIYEGAAAGAAGYLSKHSERAAICDAVVAIARGEQVFSDKLREHVVDQVRTRGADQRPLSPRESEVLSLVAGGAADSEIAWRLHLSETTVKTHLRNLYDKLGASGRAAAVAKGIRHGFIR